jgi:hypothetical protein
MPYHISELKRTLRGVKRLEIQLRFGGNANAATGRLVWDRFFKINPKSTAKYHVKDLVGIERDEFKEILDEYSYFVYFQIYRERGLSIDSMFDPNLLSLLGLGPFASEVDIKNRFRTLAKKYHPDMGGDSDKFIELVEAYDRLTGG